MKPKNKLEEITEDLHKQEHIFTEQTELGAVMENLDRDTIDKNTQMSSIDVNTRLTDEEIKACVVFDELRRKKIIPEECQITRQLKRLKISLNGKGREEKVQIVSSDREQKSGTGFGMRLKNLFVPNK